MGARIMRVTSADLCSVILRTFLCTSLCTSLAAVTIAPLDSTLQSGSE